MKKTNSIVIAVNYTQFIDCIYNPYKMKEEFQDRPQTNQQKSSEGLP